MSLRLYILQSSSCLLVLASGHIECGFKPILLSWKWLSIKN